MHSWSGFMYFFIVVLSLYGGGHYYLYKWIVRKTEPSRSMKWVLRLIFISLIISFPVARVLARDHFNSISYLTTLFSSIWMGFSLYFILLTLGSDLLLYLLRINSNIRKSIPYHSAYFRKLLAAGVMLAALGLGGYAMLEANTLGVTRIEIPLRGLPRDMDGLSIVHISDVHYGMLTTNVWLSKIVDRVNELQPDLVVITGDLVDGGDSHMEEMAGPLSGLKSRYGVFAVTGNHEYYAGVERAVSIMRNAGIKVLRNDMQILPGGLQILGIDDPSGSRRTGNDPPDFPRVLSALNPHRPSILLYHQPIHFEEVASAGIGLQLSGHTHGGQLFPVRYISKMIYPLTPGLHQIGESRLYVSRGVGTWGPPMRLGSPPELVHIRLRSQS